MSRFTTFLKGRDLYLGIVRYFLGLIMIAYGLTKILRTQIVLVPFALWQRPLEFVSGKSLAWAFLGYSQWFQVLLGILEFVPGLLLLFRRTTFFGSLVLLPVTMNVYLINQALNLWADTKVLSLILLILNIIIILFDWNKLKALFNLIIGKGKKFRFTIWEVGVNIILIGAIFFLSIPYLMDYVHQTNKLTGDWYNGHPNEWKLSSEKMGDSTLKPRELRYYFGAFGDYSSLDDSGFVKRDFYKYSIDEKKHILGFYTVNPKTAIKCTYTLINDSILCMQRPVDSIKKINVTQIFKRRVMTTSR